jgi:DNA-binding IclR family transcriptional regulator
MEMTSTQRTAPTGVQSLERVFQLLSLLADDHDAGMSMQQLVQRTGLSRPTVHRMVSFLMQRHYVEQQADSHAYRLGTAAMLLGLRTMSRPPLVETYLNTMRRIARRTGESVFLIVRLGDYSYNLHLEEGETKSSSMRALVGATRLLGIGFGSLALLATMSDADIQQHYAHHQPEYAAHGLSVGRMRVGIERCRRLGYALAAGFDVAGAGHAFKVPSGLAAISVVSPKPRMPLARRHDIAALIVQEVRSTA